MGATYDCIRTALGSGDTNELLLAYYQTNGATSNDLQDAERQFLAARGATTGSPDDRWYTFLRGRGYSGTVQDMQNTFWCVDAGVFVP